ncbi:MAG TPA: hypothetical protein VLC95_05260, partial [Anaerolineae bacterium]|nr:hypothetical protein [Anaerolineae bacterium]
MAGLAEDPEYADLKAAAVGQAGYFFYSDRYLSAPGAEKSALAEEIKARIVARVRLESGTQTRLTLLASLSALLTDLDVQDVRPYVEQIAADERYQDVRVVSAGGGPAYLFSERHITRNYAVLLARAEAGDPLATIAETVREESRLYPRPTNIDLFGAAPFNLDREAVEGYVADLLVDETYSDIRTYRASTGALYLYSENHMTEALARAKAEWEEVGRYENP